MTNFKLMTLALVSSIALTAAAPALAKDRGQQRVPFAELDKDGNGEVTLEEMEAQHAARFASVDTNGDGSLSAQELAAAGKKGKEDRAARRAAKMIERRDANDNGTLEASEMTPDGERVAKRFEKLDADGSGGLSEAELDAAKGMRGGRGGKKGGKGKHDDKTDG